MADADLTMALTLTPSLIEQLSKALVELEAHKEGATDTVSLTEITEHFRDLEAKMMKKYAELEAKEKAFKQEESESRTLLAAQEAAIAAKEQDMFDRIQVLKDAAVAAIAETRTNYPPPSIFTDDIMESIDNKVSSFLDDTKGEPSEKTGGDITFLQELVQFCEQMDTKGLLAFVTENQKNINVLCEELSLALKTSSEPGHLVLNSLEGFYPPGDTKDTAALQGMRQSCINLMEAMNAMLARADVGLNHLLNYEIKQQARAIADEWRPKLAHDGIIDAANGKSLEAEAFLQLLSTFRIASEFEEDELCKFVLAVCERRQAPELCRSLGLAHKMPGVIDELIRKGKLVSAVHFVHAFELVDNFPTVPLLKTYLKDLRRNSQAKRINSPNSESVQNEGNTKELAALREVIYCVQKYKLEAEYPLDPLHRRVGQLERVTADRKRFREPASKRESTNKRESTKHESTSKHEATHRLPHNKKPRSTGVGVYGRHSPALPYLPVNERQAPVPAPAPTPVYMDRGPYGAPSSQRYLHVDPYNYQPAPSPHNQPTYSQHIYEQNAYYYPPDNRAAAAAAAAAAPPPAAYGGYSSNGGYPSNATPPPAYGGYSSNGGYPSNGVPSSYQPYM